MPRTVRLPVEVLTRKAQRKLDSLSGKFRSLGDQAQTGTGRVTKGFKGMGASAKKYVAGAAAGALAAGGAALGLFAQQAIQKGAAFEQQMQDLSAITGIAGQDLEWLGQQARESAIEMGASAKEQVEAYKLLASNIDLSTRELASMGKEVLTLKKAAGVDLATAADTVAGTINQFGLEAAESSRVVNVLAAGSKEGAAEVNDLAQTLKNAGTSAASAGLSIEETVGAAEILSQNAIKGAEAGTQMRNMFTILRSEGKKLAKEGLHNINLESDGLTATLQKLRPIMNDAGAMTRIFGRENLNTAQVLIKNADAVGTMTQKVTGTNTAMEQAAIQMDSWSGMMDVLSAVAEDLSIAFFQTFDEDLRGAIMQGIQAVQRYRDELIGLFHFVVTNGGAAFKTFQQIAQLVFDNFGDILFNAITSLPKLIQIALETSGKNFVAFVKFIGRRLSSIGDQVKALGNLLIGALTGDRAQFNKGLDQIKGAFADTASDLVQLGKDMGSNYADAFKGAANEVLAGINTDAVKREIDGFVSWQQSVQAGQGPTAPTGGGTGGGQASGAAGGGAPTGAQQGSANQGAGGKAVQAQKAAKKVDTARLKVLGELEAAQERLKKTEIDASKQRAAAAKREGEIKAEILKQEAIARYQAMKAREEQMAQQMATVDKSIQSEKDVANAVIASVRKAVQGYLAKSIASAFASVPFPANLIAGPAAAATLNMLFNKLLGGLIPGYAQGGMISGPGGPREDKVVARLSDGEYVVNARSTAVAPSVINRINKDRVFARNLERTYQQERAAVAQRSRPAYASGGAVAARQQADPVRRALQRDTGGRAAPAAASFDDSSIVQMLAEVDASITEQTERLERVERIVDVDQAREALGERTADMNKTGNA